MRLLLDSHAFIWFTLGDSQLSSVARVLIDDAANDKLVVQLPTGKSPLRSDSAR